MLTVRNQVSKDDELKTTSRKLARRTCQRLKQASINLGMVRLQLHVGLVQDAEANLARVHEEIQTLRLRLEGKARKPGMHARSAFNTSEAKENQDNDHALLAECLG